MSIAIVERERTYLLGSETRPEELVEWSLKGKPGQRHVRDFPFGLRLGFVRDGYYPKVYIHWNQKKFDTFLKQLCTQERFLITSYGICVSKRHGRTVVRLLGAGRTSQTLWDTDLNDFSQRKGGDDVNWSVGMLRLAEEGPLFYTTHESQLELEESTAVAVITLDKDKESAPVQKLKPKSPGQVIKPTEPSTGTQLSDRARAFLLQSVLTDTSPVTHGE